MNEYSCVIKQFSFVLLLIGTCFLLSACVPNASPITSSPSRFEALTVVPDAEKGELAMSASILDVNDEDCLIRLLDNSSVQYYAVAALCKAKNKKAVPKIGEGLLKYKIRYFASALGIIGDKQGIPYLNQSWKDFPADSVAREDIGRALRMLGVKTAPTILESPQVHIGPLKVSITCDKERLYLGEKAFISVSYSNTGEYPISIPKFDLQRLELVSKDGDFIIVSGYACIDFVEPGLEAYQKIEPASTYVHRFAVSLHKMVSSEGWTQLLQEDVFYLKDDVSVGYEIAHWQEKRSVPLLLRVVYEPEPYWAIRAEQLDLKDYVGSSCKSNTITLACVGDTSD